MPHFSLHSLYLWSHLRHRYWFRCGEQHSKWWILFPSPVLRWLFPVYVNELGRDSCLMWSLGGIVQMWKQWLSSLLETALFKVLKWNLGPWRVFLVVSFLTGGVWFNLGNVRFSKNKHNFETVLANRAFISECYTRKLRSIHNIHPSCFCPSSWIISLQQQFRIKCLQCVAAGKSLYRSVFIQEMWWHPQMSNKSKEDCLECLHHIYKAVKKPLNWTDYVSRTPPTWDYSTCDYCQSTVAWEL